MPCLCVDLGWVTSNATLRVGSYNVTHHHMGVLRKKFVVVIFGVWIFGLLQPHEARDIKPVTSRSKSSKHIPHISIKIRSCSILGIDSVPDQIVQNVIIALQATDLPICTSLINPHIGNTTDLNSSLIMNGSEASLLLSKTKDPAESYKINSIMPSLSHPMNLISVDAIEESGMELGQHFLILIISKAHNISEAKQLIKP